MLKISLIIIFNHEDCNEDIIDWIFYLFCNLNHHSTYGYKQACSIDTFLTNWDVLSQNVWTPTEFTID